MLKKNTRAVQQFNVVRAGWQAAGMLLVLATLAGCGEKVHKPGQALASVNGDDVTVMQLNEELQRAGVTAQQQEAASKQVLESLIDRQLLISEAAKEKLDRDPKVIQSIERAKAMIVSQAYLQKHVAAPAKPTEAEVADYYNKHPGFFSANKIMDMRQLVLLTKDITPEVKAAMDEAKSFDDFAGWLEAHKVEFARGRSARGTADLPPELSSKMLAMPKGQIFVVREGERSVVLTIAEVKDAPVSLQAATPRIEQFLAGQRSKDAAAAELARLRSAAKVVYFNKTTGLPESAPASASTSAPANAPAAPQTDAAVTAAPQAEGDAAARGVAGLK